MTPLRVAARYLASLKARDDAEIHDDAECVAVDDGIWVAAYRLDRKAWLYVHNEDIDDLLKERLL